MISHKIEATPSFSALMGVPLTIGDEFEALGDELIDLLHMCLPVMDIHPSDLSSCGFNGNDLLINLSVCTSYEEYIVAGVFNLSSENCSRTLDINADFHLEKSDYLIFDYFSGNFLGKSDSLINLNLTAIHLRTMF